MSRRTAGLLIGLASALLVLLVALLDSSLLGTEWLYYDAVARLIARRSAPDPRIVIVSLNEKSIAALEPFYGSPQRYTRDVMALVTEEIHRGGALLVVFDYLFTEENLADPEGDRNFAAAIAGGPTVLAANTEESTGLTPPHPFQEKLWTVQDQRRAPPRFRLSPPIPMFSGATAIGTIRLNVKERAATNREYGLIERVEASRYVPTLALASAAAVRNVPLKAQLSEREFVAGDLRVPVSGNGTFFIRWHGQKKNPLDLSYTAVDFAKVVQAALARRDPDSGYTPEQIDSFSRQSFEGKIALVALTASGAATDLRATPMSPVSAGVEIHASALDNLLNGEFYREAPRLPMAILLLVVTTLASAFFHPLRSPLLTAIAALVLVGLWLGAGYVAMNQGWILRVVAPSVAILLAFVTSTTINVLVEQRQTLMLRATFGHYVSPQVLDYLLSDPARVRLGGERRELTILFSDIRGFTSISESSQPEEVVEMLNEYLSRMVDILLRHGGTLDKFIGDAVMGFWNAPTPDPDHARHAVECAIEMIEETAHLRERSAAEGKPEIRIGIGINTGDAVVGNIGSRQVFGYTVIGDAVNLASRLEGKNKDYGTEIIISEMTREKIGDTIATTYLDEVKVKGKERAVRIFEVQGWARPEKEV